MISERENFLHFFDSVGISNEEVYNMDNDTFINILNDILENKNIKFQKKKKNQIILFKISMDLIMKKKH